MKSVKRNEFEARVISNWEETGSRQVERLCSWRVRGRKRELELSSGLEVIEKESWKVMTNLYGL